MIFQRITGLQSFTRALVYSSRAEIAPLLPGLYLSSSGFRRKFWVVYANTNGEPSQITRRDVVNMLKEE